MMPGKKMRKVRSRSCRVMLRVGGGAKRKKVGEKCACV